MKTKFIKFWIQLRSLLVFVGTFVSTYLTILGLAWIFAEPITYFAGVDTLKNWLGESWWIIFYVCPIFLSLFIAYLAYRKAQHKPFLDEFDYKTQQIIKKSRRIITNTGTTFEKKEISIIESQLKSGNPVLITGEGGSGKSGIGVALAIHSKSTNKPVLIIDARQVQRFEDENALRSFYRCEEPLVQTVAELGTRKGFRLIIDQLDNTAGKPIARILIDLAIGCSKAPGIEVVVISRKRESYETKLLKDLQNNNFVEIECRQLDDREALGELQKMGFNNPQLHVAACTQKRFGSHTAHFPAHII